MRKAASAFLIFPIEIGSIGQPSLTAGANVIIDQRVQTRAIGRNKQGTTLTTKGIRPGLVVLNCAVGGGAVVIAPAGVFHAPFFVIGTVAADPNHGVDAGGATQNLAARPVVALAIQTGIRFGAIHPVDSGVVKELAIAKRQMDEKVDEAEGSIAAARLDQGHLVLAAFGQPIGQNAARTAFPHNDIVGILHAVRLLMPRGAAPDPGIFVPH